MISSDEPDISVVVPAYNEADGLGATLTALLDQDYPGPYEVIVVDNDSADDTAAIAAGYGVAVVHETARGVCPARQCGTAAARGRIVVSTDADTVPSRDWLSRIAAGFAASTQVVAVAGPCRYAEPAPGVRLMWWARAYPALMFGLIALLARVTGRVWYATATNLAFRREAFPGYDLTLTQGGDELAVLRALRPHGRIVWDSGNTVVTSARRLRRGLFYSLFVSLFVQYVLAYAINRVFSRTGIGMAPPVRPSAAPAAGGPSPRRRVVPSLVLAGTSLALVIIGGDRVLRMTRPVMLGLAHHLGHLAMP